MVVDATFAPLAQRLLDDDAARVVSLRDEGPPAATRTSWGVA